MGEDWFSRVERKIDQLGTRLDALTTLVLAQTQLINGLISTVGADGPTQAQIDAITAQLKGGTDPLAADVAANQGK